MGRARLAWLIASFGLLAPSVARAAAPGGDVAMPAAASSSAPSPHVAASAPSMTLDTLINDALRRNPGVEAKRRAYEAARGRLLAAWLPEDPEIGTNVEGQSRLFGFDRKDNRYSIEQRVPFPTTLWLRGRLAMKESGVAYQAWKEEEQAVVWHIEQPYYELLMARKTSAALEGMRSLLDRLVRVTQAKYESNKASQDQLLKAQIERAKVDVELFDWDQKAHVAQAHFSHILNQPLSTAYDIMEPPRDALPSLTMSELEELALRTRPELHALELRIGQAKTKRWLARSTWLPDVTGRIEARQYSGDGNIREYDTFLGLTVPVWSVIKGVGGGWHAAGLEVQEAEAMYQEQKNDVLLAVHEAYAKTTSAEHAVGMYEHVMLPQARQQVEVGFSAYEAGTADFLALLDAERMLKDLQVSYYTVLADYERGLSDLRRAIGGDWPAASGADPHPSRRTS